MVMSQMIKLTPQLNIRNLLQSLKDNEIIDNIWYHYGKPTTFPARRFHSQSVIHKLRIPIPQTNLYKGFIM